MIKVIEGHPDYSITDSGEVVSNKGRSPRILMQDYSADYPRVIIDNDKRYIAELVAEAFIGKPENPNYKIFHIDGNKANCEASNLVWLSPADIQRFSQFTVEYRRQVLGKW